MSTIHTPNSVQRLSRDARRAMLMRHAQNEIGRFSVWALGLGIFVVLMGRVFPALLPVPWWGVLVLAAVIAATLGVISAIRTAPSLLCAAGVLDDRLHLNSRLRSALELSRSTDPSAAGFVALALRDAQSLGDGLEVRAAQAELETRAWWVSSALLIAIVAIGLWVPSRAMAPQAPKPELPARALAGIDAASEIAQQRQDENTPESVRQELDALEALRSELEQGVSDQDEADARTAAKLEDLARALDDESEQAREQAKQISESIEAARNQAQASDEPWDPRIDEFAESLRSQRFEDAAQQIEELNRSLDSMSPTERERLAQQLEELANAVEPQEPPSSEETAQNDEAQTPEQANPPSEQAEPQDRAQEESSDSTEQDSKQQSAPDAQRDLSESLREQAERVRESNEQTPPQDRGEQSQGEQQSQEDGQRPEPTPQGEQAQEGQKQQTQEPQNEQGESQQSEGAQEQAEPQGERDGAPQEQDTQQQGEGGEESQQQQQQSESQGEEQPGQVPGQRPAQEPGQQPGQQQSLERRLRELDEQQRGARRSQEQAERLREQAQELMRSQEQPPENGEDGGVRPMPPEQNQDPSRGGGDGPRDPGTPDLVPDQSNSEFVPVDGRDREASEGGQPVGKWYGPEGEPLDPGQSGQTAQRFRRASEQAQRAIDEQQVPRRYRHLVREVFDRVKERADAIDGGGKIAPQGQDATPSKPAQSTGSGG